LSGRYKERIAIGTYLEDAAAHLGLTTEQAVSLIDDLGWTNAVLGNLEIAKENIRHGIDLAGQAGDKYLQSKGFRHLGVIEQKFVANTSAAQDYFEQAERTAEEIPDATLQAEMLAGILFNRGEGLLQMLDFEMSRRFAERALDIYRALRDSTRIIKVMTLVASVDMKSGELGRARDGFRAALTEAKRHARRDEVGKSLLGLGEVYLREEKFDLAEKALDEAATVLLELGLKPEASRAEDLLRRAEKKEKFVP
jgi:tetratricopeptide (TPR) repeat protein